MLYTSCFWLCLTIQKNLLLDHRTTEQQLYSGCVTPQFILSAPQYKIVWLSGITKNNYSEIVKLFLVSILEDFASLGFDQLLQMKPPKNLIW